MAGLRRWNNEKKLDELLPRLQGPAGEFVYGQLSHRIRTDYDALIKELNSRFRVVETARTYGAKFSNRNQRIGEPVEEYAADLKRLYDKAHSNRDRETRREDLMRRFLDGLADDRARFHVEYIKEPLDIDEAVYEVVNFQETKRRPTTLEDGMEKRNRRPMRQINVRQITELEDENDIFYEDQDIQSERIARAPPRPKKSQTISRIPATAGDNVHTLQERKEDKSSSRNYDTSSKQDKESYEMQNVTSIIKQINERLMKIEADHQQQQRHLQSCTQSIQHRPNQQNNTRFAAPP